jgi:hypothetical protein
MRNFAAVLGIGAFVLAPATAWAACTYIWDGSSSTAWDTPANWTLSGICSPNTFPDDGTDNVVVDNSLSPTRYPVLPAGADYTINDLTIHDGSSGSEVTIDVPTSRTLTVDNVMSLSDGSGAAAKKLGDGVISANSFQISSSSATAVSFEVTAGRIESY